MQRKTGSVRHWTRTSVAMIVGVLSLSSCGDDGPNDQVYARARPNAPFDDYETFAIVSRDDYPDIPDGDIVPPNDIPDDIQKGLRATEDAVRDELEDRGLSEVDPDEDPDLYVLDYAATNDKTGVIWECVPGWSWWGWWSYWDPCVWLEPVPVSYTNGSILLLLVDPNLTEDDDEGEVVFGGVARGILDNDPSDADDRIDDAVDEMFDEYPVDEIDD